MSTLRGRLEAKIEFQEAIEQDFVDTGSGTQTLSIAAGWTGWWDELQIELENQLTGWSFNAAHLETDSVALLTVSSSGGPFLITWTSTTLRDLFGFDADIASTNTPQTGADSMQGIWMPCVPKFTRHGDDDDGRLVTDMRYTVGPQGHVRSLKGSGYRVHEGWAWNGIASNKAKTHHETYANESLESFWAQTIVRGSDAFGVNSPCGIFWDSDTNGQPDVYGRFRGWKTFDPSTVIQGWVGRYNVSLPPLVVES